MWILDTGVRNKTLDLAGQKNQLKNTLSYCN